MIIRGCGERSIVAKGNKHACDGKIISMDDKDMNVTINTKEECRCLECDSDYCNAFEVILKLTNVQMCFNFL